MYGQAKPGTLWTLMWRTDIHGNSTANRHPQDNFDCLWTSDLKVNVINTNLLKPVISKDVISTNNTKDIPPMDFMQTTCVVTDNIVFPLKSQGSKTLLVLYFAEDRQIIKRIYQNALRRGVDWQTDIWQKRFCIME